ncbi:hypothetical protein HaLaN_11354, partial [Haematococcus lacustris]
MLASEWIAARDCCEAGAEAERVGYVNGKQAAHEEAEQQAADHRPLAAGLHSWLHSVGQEGILKLLREVAGEGA